MWAARSDAAVWHPCTQMKRHETAPPLPIARARGAWLHDYEGGRYLDAVGSWWVNLFGHANPRINAALREQLDTLEHVMLAGFTHAPVVELSERLSALAPGGLSHAFYGSDGASATEIALKMSFHHWRQRGVRGKDRYARLAGGYHGETVGALSVTDVALFRDAYAPLLRSHPLLPSPAVDDMRNAEAACDEAIDALGRFLAAHAASTSALIVEPLVQGARGMAMYAPRYLAAARELTRAHGVHLIADEIMTGFGRTGTMFACEQAAITPDFLCLSKGITGGYLPLSCVLTTDDVFATFYDDDVARGFLHSHSYTGNALACRAALAVLDIFRDDDVIARNREKAAQWRRGCEPLVAHPRVQSFRQCGMIVAFDVADADAQFGQRFAVAALARGIVLRPIGSTVYYMLPYIVTDDEFAWLVARTIDTLDAL
ncbi:MAG TPA: adenosylmethionine--8-amino-7-oxononanoate transaminase [Casimicrobiaceae bacterium]|jgi:adenosylmethionine-8-amino-7-oxononanoate aminotransferase|nr:adenosylmethionine--8-amino-7-oxononanoate transaminase [Casimicrobiaceae bacterium]